MKLKPCPSCGGDDIRCEDEDTKSFYCYTCDLQSRKCITIEEAIEAWNRREPMDRIVERLEGERNYALDLYVDNVADIMAKTYNKAIEIVKSGGKA